MPHESLGDFLAILEDAGELVRVAATVDAALEVAEITRRVGDGGPALFFESVRGCAMPLVTNLLGSESRLCRALGAASLGELSTRLARAGRKDEAGGWLDAFKWSPFGDSSKGFAPKVLKQGYCQQIVKLGRDVNLWELPIPRSWSEETQPVITLGQIFTRCSETQQRSVELIPLVALDPQRLVPCWHRHHQARQHWMATKAEQRQFPIAVALGGHVAGGLTALAALPSGVDPLSFSGLLQNGVVELVKCRTSDLEVPAHAEIILEGVIDPAAEQHPPPAVALPSGFYASREEPLPVIQVTAVTHRANPIFPAQIFGPPPNEETWMRKALERLFLPWIQSAAPEIVDWNFPGFGAGKSWLFVAIRKTYPLQARKVLSALWGHPTAMFVKNVVLVDEGVNIQSPDAVWSAVGTNVDPSRDVVMSDGPTDPDDRAGPGRKMGLDATRKLPEESDGRLPPRPLVMMDAIRQQVTERWAELGLSKAKGSPR